MIKTVLFQGDSITDARRDREAPDGDSSRIGYGYVALVAGKLLARNIGKEFNCINRGISGNRVVDLYARWKIDALNLKPDLLSILVGVNDTWHEFSRQNGVEVERYEKIYRMLLESISYNDFAYNKVARNKYVGKKPNAFGIDRILYKCPKCKEEHTLFVENDTVVCKKCGFRATVNEYYDLVDTSGNTLPFDIDQWYKWQRRCVAEQIVSDDFSLSLTGSICTLKLDKLRKSPDNREILSVGRATLTNRGLVFEGKLGENEVNFDFPAKSVYSLTFSTKGFLEFYHNNDYFMLVPDNPDGCLIKWTLASEEIHNLHDEKWRAACADVYEYNKGDIYG